MKLMKLIFKYCLLLTLTSVGWFVAAANLENDSANSKTLYFDKLSTFQIHQDIQSTLEAAYAKLGYNIIYLEHPLKRSYAEANAGRLSGLMARVEQTSLENLIRIPIPLKRFSIVLVINEEKCGDCTIETIENLAAVSGFKGLQKILESRELNPNLFDVHDRSTLFRIFLAGRVDAIAVSEVLMTDEFFKQQDTWRAEVIGEELLYHYLHKDYAHLVPQITQLLSEKQTNEKRLIALD